MTIRVMEEIGYDLSGHTSKHLREYLGRLPVKHLIVVCSDADRSCPAIWPGVVQRLSWPFEDPASAAGGEEEMLLRFRAVRDQIGEKVRAWAQDILRRRGR